jgi:hypothetical protein
LSGETGLDPSGALTELERSADRPKERALRDLIADSPFLLPNIDERPNAVAKEVRMAGAGRADVVVVGAGGDITIVECKLAANPEIRRWVIGQTLEYAAALWKLDYEEFKRSLARRELMAKDLGLECWGMPNVEIVHANE